MTFGDVTFAYNDRSQSTDAVLLKHPQSGALLFIVNTLTFSLEAKYKVVCTAKFQPPHGMRNEIWDVYAIKRSHQRNNSAANQGPRLDVSQHASAYDFGEPHARSFKETASIERGLEHVASFLTPLDDESLSSSRHTVVHRPLLTGADHVNY
jgi:hypothetical protein